MPVPSPVTPPPPPVRRVGQRVGRRAALTAGAGGGLVLVLGACTADGEDTGPSGPGVLRPTAPPVSADTTLATEVARAIGDTDALLAAVVTAYPALRPRLVPLRRTHAAHLRVLDELELSAPGTPRAPQGGRRVALRATLRREQVLQRELDRACLAAESGSLATLLGAMSAALGQRLAVLGAA
ncbi:hypothetical protein [Nocardioides nanhaiensis]|uniref:hypothetical protein n=1 Tax=Nocardioides nanhaiensis TaxID=1476871 RepID=UPI0031F05AAF